MAEEEAHLDVEGDQFVHFLAFPELAPILSNLTGGGGQATLRNAFLHEVICGQVVPPRYETGLPLLCHKCIQVVANLIEFF